MATFKYECPASLSLFGEDFRMLVGPPEDPLNQWTARRRKADACGVEQEGGGAAKV